MGRYRRDRKLTIEGCRSISTTFLKKNDYLCGSRWGGMKWTNTHGEETGSIGFIVRINKWNGEIRFQCTTINPFTGEKEYLDYPARLLAMPCNYGGKRWWFICPMVKNDIICNCRTMKLYLGDEKYFGCMRCHNLTYTVCQEHDARVDKLCKNPLLLAQILNKEDSTPTHIVIKAAMKLKRWPYKTR